MLITPHHLTDDELIAAVASLAGTAREATAALVAHLAELEARDLHRALGYRSLYAYCRGVLHLSEHESYHRMEAARAVRRFPVLLPLLAEGRLHLTAVSLLAPRLQDEDHLALVGGAIHKSKAEIEMLLARWFPRPDVKTSIRRAHGTGSPVGEAVAPAAASLLQGATGAAAAPGTAAPTGGGAIETASAERAPQEPSGDPGGRPVLTSPAHAPAPARGTRGTIEPLSADGYDVRFRARGETVSRLRRAQELLSHAVPDGDVDEIVFRALGELIAQAEKQRHAGRAGAGRRVRRESPAVVPATREISADVQREVWARDGGQCAFVAKGGHRCEERRFLEFHHVQPWAASGPPTTANISLRCRAHNDYEARVFFGPIRKAMQDRMAMEVEPRGDRDRAVARSGPSRGAPPATAG